MLSKPNTKLALATAALLTLGFGVTDSQGAKRHAHGNVTRQIVTGPIPLPAMSAQGVQVRCPRGWRPTGGGYDSPPPIVPGVPVSEPYSSGYQVILVNDSDTPGTFTARVTCLNARTSAAKTSADRWENDFAGMVRRFDEAVGR